VMAPARTAIDEQVAAAVAPDVTHGHRLEALGSLLAASGGHPSGYIGRPEGRQAVLTTRPLYPARFRAAES
jgi:hypothetical protein